MRQGDGDAVCQAGVGAPTTEVTSRPAAWARARLVRAVSLAAGSPLLSCACSRAAGTGWPVATSMGGGGAGSGLAAGREV